MAIEHWRHFWIHTPRLGRYTFWWDIIKRDSFVVVTAAEGRVGPRPPERFMGHAKPIVTANIAAQDGFVEFTMHWVGDFPYLDIWTDITVFDPNDPSGMN